MMVTIFVGNTSKLHFKAMKKKILKRFMHTILRSVIILGGKHDSSSAKKRFGVVTVNCGWLYPL